MMLDIFKTGDVALFSGTSLIAKIIKLFTGSKFNHIGIIVIENNIPILYESLEKGVVKNRFEIRVDKNSVIKLLRPLEVPNTLISFVNESVNVVKYDYINLLWYQFVYKTTGWWLGKTTTDKMICSEFVARCFPKYFSEPETISPNNILDNSNFQTLI